ncbi:helix-turn-helix domain-containing protein [Limimaricola cinnabarinus]|uniref:Helix-turn-helix domain-containing protein n=1 Tax=Limimaricola cinnabarinus TaxID=1125964 RepID=A0A2G1MF37_9RHOB|nr:helix-turn-helix domain-containing protein [Limimaricola cinnabarinus]PHP27358.1 helix-turn-helix domain-containing protein [Limimaricola cinnabarinus]
MIGRSFRRASAAQEAEAKGFDAFELRLGDLMRGERATLGKSLLDVQRELKIKAAYIAAIENSDPTAFDTPGFIAGYVRSYARYLGMDPNTAYETFCRESGFTTAHGMSAAASTVRSHKAVQSTSLGKDIFSDSATPFLPPAERILAGFEPRALGSVAVLLMVMGGLGYGGWSLLQEVQKVRLAPVEQTPMILSQVDPLAGGAGAGTDEAALADPVTLAAASPEALDRLYRPQALDVPVMTPRDGPIAALVTMPRRPGQDAQVVLAEGDAPSTTQGSRAVSPMLAALDAAQEPEIDLPDIDLPDIEMALVEAGVEAPSVQVTEGPAPTIRMVAVRPAWVRVTSADGTTLYEGIMNGGDSWEVPALETPPTLRVGESGALYFAVAGEHYGPVGDAGTVTSNLALSVDNLTTSYQVADLQSDSDLAELVRVAEVVPTE